MAMLDDLNTQREQITARIIELTASTQPTVMMDGKLVKTTELLDVLLKQQESLIKLINLLDPSESSITGYSS